MCQYATYLYVYLAQLKNLSRIEPPSTSKQRSLLYLEGFLFCYTLWTMLRGSSEQFRVWLPISNTAFVDLGKDQALISHMKLIKL